MNEFSGSSFKRLWAVVIKEFVEMRRDRLTFGMMVGIPLIQLVLFGFAINADPRHLPAGVVLADNGPFGRTLLEAMRHSSYYDFVRLMKTEDEADRALARGEVLFVVSIPENFSRDLVRGDRPVLLVEADATDPPPRATPSVPYRRCWTRPCKMILKAHWVSRRNAGSGGPASPCPLQPGSHHAIQRCTRLDGCCADAHDDHDHQPGDHPRTRTGHHGEFAFHAHSAVRSVSRQDRALHLRGIRPGLIDSPGSAVSFSRADGRQRCSSVCTDLCVRRRQPGGGHYVLHVARISSRPCS